MEIYEIDLVRALFANKLNDSTIFLASFYEQIDDQAQISRYVDTIKELIALQNREKEVSTYKAMGIIAQAGDSEILNIKTNYVVPTNYSVRLDIELSDRDYVLGKIKALINDLRGRKFEIIQAYNGTSYVLDTPTYNVTTEKIILTNNLHLWTTLNSDVDETNVSNNASFLSDIATTYQNGLSTGQKAYIYGLFACQAGDRYCRIEITKTPTVMAVSNITIFGNTDTEVPQLFKMSISFNGIQSQEPYINNGVDRVYLFFGGNVTITDEKVMLGNDITQTTIQVGKDTGTIYTVEPNEIPASLALDTDGYGEWGTGYQGKERIIGVANKLSYSFIYDTTNALYNAWYKYSRFGTDASTYANQIFTIKEYRYAYGVLTVDKFYAKLGEITTQNTNGDVMMLSVAMNVGAY